MAIHFLTSITDDTCAYAWLGLLCENLDIAEYEFCWHITQSCTVCPCAGVYNGE